jgi:hypothetical protein
MLCGPILFIAWTAAVTASSASPAPSEVDIETSALDESTGDSDRVFPPSSEASGPDASRMESWREAARRSFPARAGCFIAEYPNLEWKEVDCIPAESPLPSLQGEEPVLQSGNYLAAVVGGGNMRSAQGYFPVVSCITAESDSAYGPGVFSAQLNTDTIFDAACAPSGGCSYWQQWIYRQAPGTVNRYMLIQYWMLNYPDPCPANWNPDPSGCYRNSVRVTMPYVGVQGFRYLVVAGASNGNTLVDSMQVQTGGVIYGLNNPSILNFGNRAWRTAEFGVFGFGSYSAANFLPGTRMLTRLNTYADSIYSTPIAPICVSGTTTGETSNLTLGNCSADPSGIQYLVRTGPISSFCAPATQPLFHVY